jgi:hypothetical protein
LTAAYIDVDAQIANVDLGVDGRTSAPRALAIIDSRA